MAIAPVRKTKIAPIVVSVLVVLIVIALGWFVFKTLTDDNEAATPEGQGLDTSVLESEKLELLQYESASAPEVDEALMGRDNPFAPY